MAGTTCPCDSGGNDPTCKFCGLVNKHGNFIAPTAANTCTVLT